MRKPLLLMLCLLLLVSLTGCVKTYTYQAERKDQDLVGNRGIVKGEVPPPVTGRKRTRTMGAMDIELPAGEEYVAKKEALGKETPPEKEAKKAKKKSAAKKKAEKELAVKTEVAEGPIAEEPGVAGEAEAVGAVKEKIVEEAVTKKITEVPLTEKVAEKAVTEKVTEVPVTEKTAAKEIKAPPAVRIEYTVKEGDTLEKIANNCFGDGSKWPVIYEANKEIIKHPSKIYPGTVIVIPQLEPEEEKTEEAYK